MEQIIGLVIAFGSLLFWINVLEDINEIFLAALITVILICGIAQAGIWVFA